MSASIIDKRGNIIYTAPKIGYTYFSEGLCRVITETTNGEYLSGYINQSGKLVIPFQFEDAGFFNGGVAPVKKNGRWGIINSKGKLICPFYHKKDNSDDVPTIHDGIIRRYEAVPGDREPKLSYIDSEGNIVIDTRGYSYIGDFCNGFAVVENQHREYALINTKGEIIIPFGRYSSIGEVHCGVAEVRQSINGKYCCGYVNTSGVEVVPLGKYEHFYCHKADLCVVCAINGDKCGYIDKSSGEELIPCIYRFNSSSTEAAIHPGFYDDYYEDSMIVIKLKEHVQTTANEIFVYNVKQRKLYYLTDIDDIASHFSEGLCAVKKGSKVGFIDDSCKLIIPYIFDCSNNVSFSVLRFKEDVCPIESPIGIIFINKRGTVIKQFDNLFCRPRYIGDGAFRLDRKNGAGIAIVNVKGDFIFNGYRAELNGPLHSEFPIAVIDQNVSYNNTWRFINKDGKSAFPLKFQEGYTFKNGFAIIDETITSRSTTTTRNNNSATSTSSKSGCYIATAVYGAYDCPEVWTLRRYRDFVLDKTWYGKVFIHIYYAISPVLVKWFGNSSWFITPWRKLLDKIVFSLNECGVDDSPYNDLY